MQKRPKININLTKTDKIIEIIGLVSVGVIWFLTLFNYNDLPATIPTHFNGSGEADGFGNKIEILTSPVISTVIYISLTILSRYPHKFNYITEITEKNALYQYTIATKLLRFLKISIIWVFTLIVLGTIQFTQGNKQGIIQYFLPISMFLIFTPIFYFLIKSSNEN